MNAKCCATIIILFIYYNHVYLIARTHFPGGSMALRCSSGLPSNHNLHNYRSEAHNYRSEGTQLPIREYTTTGQGEHNNRSEGTYLPVRMHATSCQRAHNYRPVRGHTTTGHWHTIACQRNTTKFHSNPLLLTVALALILNSIMDNEILNKLTMVC